MRRGQPITFRQLQSAYTDVQRELERAGLWHQRGRLINTQVVLCKLPPPDFWDAAAFFVREVNYVYRAFGCEPGHIYVPKWIWRLKRGQYRGSLRDILRHEFGHALAFHYPGPICRTRAFAAAFDARYDDPWPEPPQDPANFVTEYAMNSPEEDFAETFMVWLRGFSGANGRGSHYGRKSPDRITPALRAKFRFVRDVCRQIGK
jgi:hypothetical protein